MIIHALLHRMAHRTGWTDTFLFGHIIREASRDTDGDTMYKEQILIHELLQLLEDRNKETLNLSKVQFAAAMSAPGLDQNDNAFKADDYAIQFATSMINFQNKNKPNTMVTRSGPLLGEPCIAVYNYNHGLQIQYLDVPNQYLNVPNFNQNFSDAGQLSTPNYLLMTVDINETP